MQLVDIPMFRNYLIVAVRNVWKNKAFSIINVLGLSIGLTACLLIFQFVSLDFSYDTFNEKLIQHGTIMYPTIGATMAKDFPEIEDHTRMMPAGVLKAALRNPVETIRYE